MQGCCLPIGQGIGSGCNIGHSPILFLMVFTTICLQFVLHVFLNFILYGLGKCSLCCSPNSYLPFTCVPSIILYALPNIPYVVLICSPCCSQLASHFIPYSLPKLLLFLAYILGQIEWIVNSCSKPSSDCRDLYGGRQVTRHMTKTDFWALDVHTKYVVKTTDRALGSLRLRKSCMYCMEKQMDNCNDLRASSKEQVKSPIHAKCNIHLQIQRYSLLQVLFYNVIGNDHQNLSY